MYIFYINGEPLPLAPAKLTTKIQNKNKSIDLVNGGEINVLNAAGLTEIDFDVLLPNAEYPSTFYLGKFKPASYYLSRFERFKTAQKPFYFVVTRYMGTKLLYDTRLRVSLENYTIKEDVKQGFDAEVSISLKQYVDYGVQKITILEQSDKNIKVAVVNKRAIDAPPHESVYIIQDGDTLWSIAKSRYGDGSLYGTILTANVDRINDPLSLVRGTALYLPEVS